MTGTRKLRRVPLLRTAADQVHSTGLLWFVDRTGTTTLIGLDDYATLTAEHLNGSHVFFSAESARRYVLALGRDRN